MINELRKEQNWLIIMSLGILTLLALGTMLIYARSVLIPFVLAIFIYLLISPLFDMLVLKLKFPRMIAVAITLVILVGILSIVFFILAEAVQLMAETANSYSESFFKLVDNLYAKVEEHGIDFDYVGFVKDFKGRIPKFLADTILVTRGIISTITFVTIFLIFLLSGRNPHLVHKGVYGVIDSRIRHYIAMKTVLSFVTALLVWSVLTMFSLKLALVFGMLTFILNFIPSIGSIVATFLPLPIAVAQFQSPVMVFLVILIPGAIQITIGNLIEPKVMGQGLKLHPVTILLALSFWGLLWGIIGMLLAVPITAAIRIVLMQFETLRPVGKLLAGQLPQSEYKEDE